MKKFFCTVLAIFTAFSFCSCGSAEDDFNVAVFYYTFSDTYMSSVKNHLDKALDDAGIKHQNYDGNSNQTTQNEQIDTAISKGCDLIAVNIVTSGSVDASRLVADKAKAAGIPVIFFNRAIESDSSEGEVLGAYEECAFIGTDAAEAGHLQGKMIGEYVKEHFAEMDINGDNKISYALFMGQLGNNEAIYRTRYSVEDADDILHAAGKNPLEYFDKSNRDRYQADQDGNWSATAANNYMTTNLSQYNEKNGNMIELVICNNDGMAEGAISALNDRGYNLGNGGRTIPVFGIDATDAARQLISDGKMTGTVKQDALGMAKCIEYLIENKRSGLNLTDGTDAFTLSPTLKNKIYIPYSEYKGE